MFPWNYLSSLPWAVFIQRFHCICMIDLQMKTNLNTCLPYTHAFNAQLPALDHHLATQLEINRLSIVLPWGVEDGTILKGTLYVTSKIFKMWDHTTNMFINIQSVWLSVHEMKLMTDDVKCITLTSFKIICCALPHHMWASLKEYQSPKKFCSWCRANVLKLFIIYVSNITSTKRYYNLNAFSLNSKTE